MTLSPPHPAWQAVASLAALVYTPTPGVTGLLDRLTAILEADTTYQQGVLLLGTGVPYQVAGLWGVEQQAADELRLRPLPASNNGALRQLSDGWSALDLAVFERPVGLLLLRTPDDAAPPEELLIALAAQLSLLISTTGLTIYATPLSAAEQVQVVSSLLTTLYDRAGNVDLTSFCTAVAQQSTLLPYVVGAAVYLGAEKNAPLDLAAAAHAATAPPEAGQFEQQLDRAVLRGEPLSGPALLPLVLEGQPHPAVLVLRMQSDDPQLQLEPNARSFFASQLGLAVRTTRIAEEQRLQGRDLFILYENSRTLSSTLDLGTIMDRLCENVAFALESDHCIVMLWDEQRGEMEYASAFDAVNPLQLGSFPIGARFKPQPESVAGLVLRSGKPLAVEDVANDPRIPDDRNRMLSFGFKSILCSPIIQHDKLLGILLVSSYSLRSYASSEVTLIQTLSGQAAVALSHARVLDEERQRSTELELLHRLSHDLSSGLSVQEAAEAVMRAVDRLLPGVEFEICSYDAMAQVLRTVLRSKTATELGAPSQVYQLDEGLTGWLARHRRPLRVGNIAELREPRPLSDSPTANRRMRSFLGMPLLVGDELVGTLEIAAPKLNAFSDDDERLVSIISSQAAQVMRNAISYETADEVLRRRIKELTALQRVSRKLTSTLYLDSILATVLSEAQEATAAPTGLVVLKDEIARFAEALTGTKFAGYAESTVLEHDQGGMFRLVAVEGYSEADQVQLIRCFGDSQGVFRMTITEQQPQIIDDLAGEEHAPKIESASLLLVPVIYEQQIAGIILLGHSAARAFTRDELDFVRALADQAALAIGNAQHFAEMERQRELLQRRAGLLNEVLEIGNALRADRELPDLLEQIAFSVADAAAFRSVLFILSDQENPHYMRIVSAAGIPITTLDRLRERPLLASSLHPLLDRSFRLGRGYFVPAEQMPENVLTLSDRQSDEGTVAPDEWHPGDLLLVPLYSTEREMIGLLVMDDPFDHQRPSRRTVETIEIFANQAAIAVENAWLFRQHARQIEDLSILNQVGQQVSMVLTIDEIANIVLDGCVSAFRLDYAVFSVVDELSEQVRAVAARNVPEEQLVLSHQPLSSKDIMADVVRSQQVEVINGWDPRFNRELFEKFGHERLHRAFIPFVVRGRSLGLLEVGYTDGVRRVMPDMVRVLQALANQTAVALENAQLFTERERQIRELDAIGQIGQLVSASFDLDEMLYGIQETLHQLTDSSVFYLAIYEPDSDLVTKSFMVDRGERVDTDWEQAPPRPGSLTETIIRERRPLLFQQLVYEEGLKHGVQVQSLGGDERVSSWVGVPLLAKGGEPIGILSLQDYRPFRYDQQTIDFLLKVASHVSLGLQKVQLFTERERQIRELDAIRRVGQVTSSSLEIDRLLRGVYEVLVNFLPVDSFILHVIDIDAYSILRSLMIDLDEALTIENERPIPQNSLTQWLVTHRRPLFFGDFRRELDGYPEIVPSVLGAGDEAPSWLGVPLLARDGQPIGIMAIQNYRPYAYTARDVDFMVSVAHQVSLGLQNARLFAATERNLQRVAAETERLRTVNRVSNLAASLFEAEALYQLAVDEMARATGADQARLALFDRDRREAMVRAQHQEAEVESVTFGPQMQVIAWLERERRPLRIDDAHNDEILAPFREQLGTLGIISVLFVPLVVKGEIIGAVSVEHHHQSESFSDSDVETCQTIANQIVTSLENARLLEATTEQARALSGKVGELSAVLEASRALSSLHEPALVLDTLVRVVGRQLNVATVALLTLEPDGTLVPSASLGLADEFLRVMRVRVGQGMSGTVAATGEPLFVRNASAQNSSSLTSDEALSSYLGVPVRFQDRVLGVLSVMTSVEREFTQDEVALLSGLADQAAIALENARLFSQRERQIRVLQALNEIGTAVASTLEIDQLLALLHRELGRVVNTSRSLIALYDHSHQLISFPVAYEGGESVKLPKLPLAEGVLSRVIRDGKPIRLQTREEVENASRVLLGAQTEQPSSWLGVPIISADQVLGVINIQSMDAYAFDDETVQFLQSVASQAAVALENARLFRERGRRIRELDAINRITQAVTSTLDLKAVLERLHNGLGEVVNVNTSLIALYDPRSNILSYPLCFDNGQPVYFPPAPMTGQNLNSWVIRNRQPILVGTAEEAAAYRGGVIPVHTRIGTPDRIEQSYLVVPINVGEQVLGVINIQSYELYAFDPEDLNFVTTVANQAAVAIDNARLFSERERSIMELGTLNKISHALSSTVRLEDLLSVIYEQTSLLLDTTNFYMALYDDRRRTITYPFFYEHGQPLHIPPQGDTMGLTAYVIKSRKPLMLGAELPEFLQEHNIAQIGELSRSWLGVPMIAADKVIGVIGIQDYEREHAYGEQDVRLLSTIANQAAQALENARLFTESRESVRDLTTLSDTSVSLASTLELQEILTIGASSAMELARADYGGLFTIEGSGRSLKIGEAILLDNSLTEVPIADVRKYGLRSIRRLAPLREGQILTIADSAQDEQMRPFSEFFSMRGVVVLPIMKEQQLSAVMLVGSTAVQEFEERVVNSLNILAAQVGQALENAQLFDQIRRFNAELEEKVTQRTQALAQEKERIEALYTIATELGRTLNLNELLLQTLDLASRSLGVSRGSIVLRDRETGAFICRAVLVEQGEPEAVHYEVPLKPGEGLISWIIEHPNEDGTVIDDVNTDQRWALIPGRSEGVRSVIAVPLTLSQVAEGVLMFTSTQPNAFAREHLLFLRTIANQVSAALNNAELFNLVLDTSNRISEALTQQREEAGKREAILRSVSEGVMVFDPSGTIILYNPAAERMLGVPGEVVIGHQLQIFAEHTSEGAEERALLIYSGLHDGLKGLDEQETASTVISLGSQTIASTFAPVTSADGLQLGVVAVLRDITLEIEADRAKRQFIDTVSHELRTPLTPINGYVDMMVLGVAGPVSDMQKEFLSIIKTNTNRMRSLVDDLLEIGRIEAGKVQLNFAPTDLRQSINETLIMLGTKIRDKEMDVQVEVEEDLPLIEADSKRVGQVVTNLISNAVKYTFSGGSVWIRAFRSTPETLEFHVEDTGVGLTEEQMGKLFNRFYRADNPLRDQEGGTGLGLTIAKSFIELHQGEMWVRSQINVGSTFGFTIPVTQPRPAIDGAEEELAGGPQAA